MYQMGENAPFEPENTPYSTGDGQNPRSSGRPTATPVLLNGVRDTWARDRDAAKKRLAGIHSFSDRTVRELAFADRQRQQGSSQSPHLRYVDGVLYAGGSGRKREPNQTGS